MRLLLGSLPATLIRFEREVYPRRTARAVAVNDFGYALIRVSILTVLRRFAQTSDSPPKPAVRQMHSTELLRNSAAFELKEKAGCKRYVIKGARGTRVKQGVVSNFVNVGSPCGGIPEGKADFPRRPAQTSCSIQERSSHWEKSTRDVSYGSRKLFRFKKFGLRNRPGGLRNYSSLCNSLALQPYLEWDDGRRYYLRRLLSAVAGVVGACRRSGVRPPVGANSVGDLRRVKVFTGQSLNRRAFPGTGMPLYACPPSCMGPRT